MHIHHNPTTSGNSGIHSAAAAEKAAAAQRAAETRHKLLKRAANIDGTLDAGELFMVGRWSEDNAGKRESQQQRLGNEGDSSEEETGINPISVWA